MAKKSKKYNEDENLNEDPKPADEPSKGCEACGNTGLKDANTLCPECDGSPYGVSSE